MDKMRWSESLVKCANNNCGEMITRKFNMDDRGAWMEDVESSCCCADDCHGAHIEQIKADLVKDRRAQRPGKTGEGK